jgi:hypothetical protein
VNEQKLLVAIASVNLRVNEQKLLVAIASGNLRVNEQKLLASYLDDCPSPDQ